MPEEEKTPEQEFREDMKGFYDYQKDRERRERGPEKKTIPNPAMGIPFPGTNKNPRPDGAKKKARKTPSEQPPDGEDVLAAPDEEITEE